MKCSICSKEYKPTRKDSKVCSASCRMKSSRAKLSVTKNELSVTKNGVSVTDNVNSVTDNHNLVTDKLDKLRFTTETIDERIKIYEDIVKDVHFVPNWIASGHNSKEDAVEAALERVRAKF